jgi:hypothetical protein
MKNPLGCLMLSITTLLLVGIATAEPAGDNPPPRLTIELRDGSRVVGQSVDDQFKFDSALLGTLKLAVKNIRAIECVSTNSAKLTTASGDLLTGWFDSEMLRVKTGFGKVELAVNSIRHIAIAATRAPGKLPPGLVALWSAEGDGHDSVGGNDATLTDITFAEGKVGQAFSFNGTSSWIKIPDSPALDVGTGEGFTVTAWIKPSRVDGIYIGIEWSDYLCAFQLGNTPGDQGGIVSSIFDSGRNNHFLRSRFETLVPNTFQHIAVTFDKASGNGTLYVNGNVVAQSYFGSIVPLTKGGLRIGFRPSNPGDWSYNRFFVGLMDEIAIYNRALSASEIQAVCTEQNLGEPLPKPPTAGNPGSPFNGRFPEANF